MVILLALIPLTIAMVLRAQAQMQNIEAGRNLFLASERSVHENNYPRAIEQLEEAVSLWPELTGAWESLALCYHREGQQEKAYQTYERGIEKNPGNPDLRFGLGAMYLRDDRYELAMVTMDRLMEVDPSDLRAPRLRRHAETKLHKRASAP